MNRSFDLVSIAKFYEYDLLDLIDYDRYSRCYIWKQRQQELFLDSIIKNYPTPNILLEQNNNIETGSITYSVIDGKQRLLTIKKFINNEIPVLIDNNKFFFQNLDISRETRKVKREFWKYILHTEYITVNSEASIREIILRIHP